jgi:hypothetical protein
MNAWKGVCGLEGRRGERRRREGSLGKAAEDVFQLCHVPLPTYRTVYRSRELVKTL